MVMTANAPDILADSPDVALGRGWYGLENFAGTRFRWASNDAEVFVVAMQPVRHSLRITIEPGPGVGLKPFKLKVLESGTEVGTFDVRGKETITIGLPPAGPKIYRVILHVDGGGKTIANDNRVLNFRVFEMAVERGERDVLPATMDLGAGWYPLEKGDTGNFRWVSGDARVVIRNKDGGEFLDLDLEPGPGLEHKPFVLHVLQNVKGEFSTVADVQIAGRHRVEVPVPKGDVVELALRVDASGVKVPGDSRELNFRVFQYAGPPAPRS